jgi:hypothetical protein
VCGGQGRPGVEIPTEWCRWSRGRDRKSAMRPVNSDTATQMLESLIVNPRLPGRGIGFSNAIFDGTVASCVRETQLVLSGEAWRPWPESPAGRPGAANEEILMRKRFQEISR